MGISTDLSCASSVNAAFKEISALNNGNGITLAAAIYNVGGKFVRKPFLDLTLEEFEAGFDVGG